MQGAEDDEVDSQVLFDARTQHSRCQESYQVDGARCHGALQALRVHNAGKIPHLKFLASNERPWHRAILALIRVVSPKSFCLTLLIGLNFERKY